MNDPDRTSTDYDDALWQAVARSLSGEASPEQEAALRLEMDAHPGRAELVGALGDAVAGVRADAAPPVDVEAALASVMARRDRPALTVERGGAAGVPAPRRPAIVPSARPRWRTPAVLAAAAALILAIGGALVWRTLRPHAGGWQARYATAVGGTQAIELPDGSRVLLGPASRLVVANGYGDDERRLRLHGEAFFDVVHDDVRPFEVVTDAARVTDVGTAFTVATGGQDSTRVVVTHGSVKVTPPGRGATVLRAGDRASVARGGVKVERGAATREDVAWTTGRLVFRDAPLAEVAAEMRRWYGVTLRVDDPALAARHLTADFQGQSAGAALRIVAATLGGELRMRGDTAVIVRPGGGRRAP
ncbi:FecR family protein [Longimicrobium sp.]|uniref:FecR family protein n=1 Tax=Longimicrobium sp. TaxID=2029185 RepID=UPI002C585509|nr:FecR domain-containing protein [Longimicrobium sp.]HSU17557.1 FecR domain-containing protein [Longimicrobium sp.]